MANNSGLKCNCDEQIQINKKIYEEQAFATVLIKDINKTCRAIIIALIVETILWFSTIAGFAYYLNQVEYITQVNGGSYQISQQQLK